MKRCACLLVAVVGVLAAVDSVHAEGWGSLSYGGHQPWWNIFAKRNPYMSIEEERLQRFWHDYYDAMRRYYSMLDRIDWVAYYKNHGYQINSGMGGCGPNGGSSRVQFAPVFVSPQMNWAVPNSALSGTPAGPGYPPPQAFPNFHGGGQMGGGYPQPMPGPYPQPMPGGYPQPMPGPYPQPMPGPYPHMSGYQPQSPTTGSQQLSYYQAQAPTTGYQQLSYYQPQSPTTGYQPMSYYQPQSPTGGYQQRSQYQTANLFPNW